MEDKATLRLRRGWSWNGRKMGKYAWINSGILPPVFLTRSLDVHMPVMDVHLPKPLGLNELVSVLQRFLC